jgi:DNA-binding transcriptional ArsR family regulator
VSTNQVSNALGALSDPTRRAIFEKLFAGPSSVGDLASEFPVSRPAVSQHLRVLKDAGLVVDHADGTRRVYQVHPPAVEAIRAYFDRFWSTALSSFKQAAEKRSRKTHG